MEPKRAQKWLRGIFWSAITIVGFVQAWAVRFTLSQDGNNYLDIASAYLRGDFAHAINAYWSPLFSWLVAAALWAIHPCGYWEAPLLHLLNFLGLLLSLLGFEIFFPAFLGLIDRQTREGEETALSTACWWLLGYLLFFSTSLYVIGLGSTTPDIWVCALTYFAVYAILRISLDPRNILNFALLGLLLGLGYLTKSFYFPLSFVFLTAAALLAGRFPRAIVRLAVAFGIFLVVSGPFIIEISLAKHRFTFGESGKITYAEFVNPILGPFFWQGDAQSGTPKNPPRQILAKPRIFEFATPIVGSYPLSYDQSYWMDGVKPHINLRGQLRIMRQSAGSFFQIFVVQAEFATGILTMFFLLEDRHRALASLIRLWPLWLPGLAGCLAYSLVLVESRYVAPFIPFLWLACFGALARLGPRLSRRTAAGIVLGMLCVTGVRTAKSFVSDLALMNYQKNAFWEVAQGLHNMGIEPGDRVAIIAGNAIAHWARLSRVKIVAELPLGDDELFWSSDEATQHKVYSVFAGTGARAIVVMDPPLDAVRQGWMQIGDTRFYAYLLPRSP
ncbi:MAG TPA: hypothetical protein VL128_15480 [Candidatus Eisenbacteria bacterium]|nr:hypothetical protein [Candidatus Eisenbacteria bacterium]